MPQGPEHLQRKWQDDGKAIAHLESRGFTLSRDFEWTQPKGHVYSADDNSALDYLVLEWDYGGVVNFGA